MVQCEHLSVFVHVTELIASIEITTITGFIKKRSSLKIVMNIVEKLSLLLSHG